MKRISSKIINLPNNTDLQLDLTEYSDLYIINSNNVTLTTDVSIITTGAPKEDSLIWLYYDGNVTLDGNELEILGTNISEYADEKLLVYSIYKNAAWRTAFLNFNGLKLGAGSIITGALADSAVTTVKIADNNVTTAKILDNNITTAKILDAAITTVKILDANVTSVKLATNSVTTAKITDSNVTTAKIADANITEAKIANGAVAPSKLEQVG